MAETPKRGKELTETEERARKNFDTFIKERNLTNQSVANRSGIPIGTVQKLRNGQRKITIEQAAALANALVRSPGDFFAEKPGEAQPMKPIAFELQILDDEVSEELRRRALQVIDELNAEYARNIDAADDIPSLPGRQEDASALHAAKAGTKSRQRLEPKQLSKQPSPEKSSKKPGQR